MSAAETVWSQGWGDSVSSCKSALINSFNKLCISLHFNCSGGFIKDFCIHSSVSRWPWLTHQLCFLICGVEGRLLSLVAPAVSVSDEGLGRGEAVTARCEQRRGSCGHVFGGQGGTPAAPPSHILCLPCLLRGLLGSLLAPAPPVPHGLLLSQPPVASFCLLLPTENKFTIAVDSLPCQSQIRWLFFSVLLFLLTVASAPPLRWFSWLPEECLLFPFFYSELSSNTLYWLYPEFCPYLVLYWYCVILGWSPVLLWFQLRLTALKFLNTFLSTWWVFWESGHF